MEKLKYLKEFQFQNKRKNMKVDAVDLHLQKPCHFRKELNKWGIHLEVKHLKSRMKELSILTNIVN
jgi:hypothetical protein